MADLGRSGDDGKSVFGLCGALVQSNSDGYPEQPRRGCQFSSSKVKEGREETMGNGIQDRRRAASSHVIIPALSKKSKLCGTCAFWTGSRKIKPGGKIEYHPYSKGVCDGGGFSSAAMSAMATCGHWELWSLMDSSQTSPAKGHENPVSA
jgi:hypothetical protein